MFKKTPAPILHTRPSTVPGPQVGIAAFCEHLQCLRLVDLVACLGPGVDLERLVRLELSYRGRDATGGWVGFLDAAALVDHPPK